MEWAHKVKAAHQETHIIVSISTPRDRAARIATNDKTLGIVRLWFHDLDRYVEECMADIKHELFQPSQADMILDLLDKHPDAELFVVHCDAGLSRSPAVAAAISKITTGEDQEYFKRYHPNMLVYRTILERHQERQDGKG